MSIKCLKECNVTTHVFPKCFPVLPHGNKSNRFETCFAAGNNAFFAVERTGGSEHGRIGGGGGGTGGGRRKGGKREEKGREAGFPKWWEPGEMEKKFAILRNFLQQKLNWRELLRKGAGSGSKRYGRQEFQTPPVSPPLCGKTGKQNGITCVYSKCFGQHVSLF